MMIKLPTAIFLLIDILCLCWSTNAKPATYSNSGTTTVHQATQVSAAISQFGQSSHSFASIAAQTNNGRSIDPEALTFPDESYRNSYGEPVTSYANVVAAAVQPTIPSSASAATANTFASKQNGINYMTDVNKDFGVAAGGDAGGEGIDGLLPRNTVSFTIPSYASGITQLLGPYKGPTKSNVPTPNTGFLPPLEITNYAEDGTNKETIENNESATTVSPHRVAAADNSAQNEIADANGGIKKNDADTDDGADAKKIAATNQNNRAVAQPSIFFLPPFLTFGNRDSDSKTEDIPRTGGDADENKKPIAPGTANENRSRSGQSLFHNSENGSAANGDQSDANKKQIKNTVLNQNGTPASNENRNDSNKNTPSASSSSSPTQTSPSSNGPTQESLPPASPESVSPPVNPKSKVPELQNPTIDVSKPKPTNQSNPHKYTGGFGGAAGVLGSQRLGYAVRPDGSINADAKPEISQNANNAGSSPTIAKATSAPTPTTLASTSTRQPATTSSTTSTRATNTPSNSNFNSNYLTQQPLLNSSPIASIDQQNNQYRPQPTAATAPVIGATNNPSNDQQSNQYRPQSTAATTPVIGAANNPSDDQQSNQYRPQLNRPQPTVATAPIIGTANRPQQTESNYNPQNAFKSSETAGALPSQSQSSIKQQQLPFNGNINSAAINNQPQKIPTLNNNPFLPPLPHSNGANAALSLSGAQQTNLLNNPTRPLLTTTRPNNSQTNATPSSSLPNSQSSVPIDNSSQKDTQATSAVSNDYNPTTNSITKQTPPVPTASAYNGNSNTPTITTIATTQPSTQKPNAKPVAGTFGGPITHANAPSTSPNAYNNNNNANSYYNGKTNPQNSANANVATATQKPINTVPPTPQATRLSSSILNANNGGSPVVPTQPSQSASHYTGGFGGAPGALGNPNSLVAPTQPSPSGSHYTGGFGGAPGVLGNQLQSTLSTRNDNLFTTKPPTAPTIPTVNKYASNPFLNNRNTAAQIPFNDLQPPFSGNQQPNTPSSLNKPSTVANAAGRPSTNSRSDNTATSRLIPSTSASTTASTTTTTTTTTTTSTTIAPPTSKVPLNTNPFLPPKPIASAFPFVLNKNQQAVPSPFAPAAVKPQQQFGSGFNFQGFGNKFIQQQQQQQQQHLNTNPFLPPLPSSNSQFPSQNRPSAFSSFANAPAQPALNFQQQQPQQRPTTPTLSSPFTINPYNYNFANLFQNNQQKPPQGNVASTVVAPNVALPANSKLPAAQAIGSAAPAVNSHGSGKYTGGFGGPPGVLKPFDNVGIRAN